MTNIVKNILLLLVFVFFIVAPFWFLRDVILSASDDTVEAMLIRFIMGFRIPYILIILMPVFNIVGFCILRKNRYWNMIAFLYLCLQAFVSAVFLFVSITAYDWNDLFRSANELHVSLSELMLVETMVSSDLYYKLAINVMWLFNVLTVIPVAVIHKIKNKKCI